MNSRRSPRCSRHRATLRMWQIAEQLEQTTRAYFPRQAPLFELKGVRETPGQRCRFQESASGTAANGPTTHAMNAATRKKASQSGCADLGISKKLIAIAASQTAAAAQTVPEWIKCRRRAAANAHPAPRTSATQTTEVSILATSASTSRDKNICPTTANRMIAAGTRLTSWTT